MTPCDEYQARIVALLDNEAGDEDLRLAAGHLQDCPECRAFFRGLIGIRRTLTAAPLGSLSTTARQAILDKVRDDQSGHSESHTKGKATFFRLGRVTRWAAVLAIGGLSIACFALDRTAEDLRTKLGAAEREVAAIHEQAKLAESEERQRKAISALYFRMAELEDRVNRSSRPERASVPAHVYKRREKQSDL
jgi:anti-sigma factor RsiW